MYLNIATIILHFAISLLFNTKMSLLSNIPMFMYSSNDPTMCSIDIRNISTLPMTNVFLILI